MPLSQLVQNPVLRIDWRACAFIFFMITALGFVAPVRAGEPSAFDSDGDGYDDTTEIANGWSPYGSGRLAANDADGDGLSDGDEIARGTSPLAADTDGDGYADGQEIFNAYDPLDAAPKKIKKRIVISIDRQELTYYLGKSAVATRQVSTGRPGHPTPLGTYAILDKKPRAWSATAKLWMPYWMPFIGTKYGLHELPEWPGGKKEGEDHLGTPVSGGCIRLGVGAAKELYEWADVGTEVIISKT
ncbi:MAG: L,D-transpeptidase family protein [Patescibacteria group bacterium]